MTCLNRRTFIKQCAALGFGATACAVVSTPSIAHGQPTKADLLEFGAVPDGRFDSQTRQVSGTDNTDAINAALASGMPVEIPAGQFYYSGPLHTRVDGSGLIGKGSQRSMLITDQSLDRHLSVIEGTRRTTWVGFGMIGPFDAEGKKYNRALTIGTNRAGTETSVRDWDASGTWIENFATHGYCVGLHVAGAAEVRFGTIHVHEAGDSRAEPGSYGITCSGSNLRGKLLRAVSKTTRGRHALYFTGPANNCFVEKVEATGFDFAAVQNRATLGGGRRNGFRYGHFQDCNTNTTEAVTLRGVVNFSCADDKAVKGAGEARIGSYTAIECGGFPGPSLRFMPDSECSKVDIVGHSGDFVPGEHYGAHIYRSDNVRLPVLNFVSGFSASELKRESLTTLAVEESQDCYGGGIEFQPGAVTK